MQDLHALYNVYLTPTFRFDQRQNVLNGKVGSSIRRFSVPSCISFKTGIFSEILEATDQVITELLHANDASSGNLHYRQKRGCSLSSVLTETAWIMHRPPPMVWTHYS
jgi:hypothetical protein